jgi:hypothetical protein
MNLILDRNKYSINNIYFNECVKNTIMNDSNFIRIIYSNKDLILNGIHIKINIYKEINQIKSDNYNNETLIFIQDLEKDLLNKYNKQKTQNNKIKEQLHYLINKINNSNVITASYILKISGIWETSTNQGLTYKFIYLNDRY